MSELFKNTSEKEKATDSQAATFLGQRALTQLVSVVPCSETETAPKSDVIELFESETLLVRAMDSLRLSRDGTDIVLDYETIDRELSEVLESPDGLSYASSTLLIPEKSVPTYKGFGFIFDGNKSDIHHLSEMDSVSSGQGDDFRASKSDIHSLAELATAVKEETSPNMNEVNATFKSESLKGLFALEAMRASSVIDAWFSQQHIKQTTGIDLPLYTYSIKQGALKETTHDVDEMRALIDTNYREGSVIHTAYSGALNRISENENT